MSKDPSYPWYPRDFAADEPVQLMSLEAEGAYRRLLDHQWLHGSIPKSLDELARICKRVSVRRMKRIMSEILCCFSDVVGDPDRLQNQRLERVRAEREAFRLAKSDAGKMGAEAKKAKAQLQQDDSTASTEPQPALALASALALESSSVLSEPGEPDSEQNPMGACMGALREALYVGGKDPGTGASDRDATIIRGWLRKGRAASEVVAAIRGFGLQRDAGLLPWPPGTPLTARALNSMIAGKNPYPAAVDYWYAHRDRAPPDTTRERTGPTHVGNLLREVG